jgi:hypothetical protein
MQGKKARIKMKGELDTIMENNEFAAGANYSNSDVKSRSTLNNNSFDKFKSLTSTNEGKRCGVIPNIAKGEMIKKAFDLGDIPFEAEQPVQKLVIKIPKPDSTEIERLRKNKDNIIVKVKKQQSNVIGDIYLNDNEVLINEKSLAMLSRSIYYLI